MSKRLYILVFALLLSLVGGNAYSQQRKKTPQFLKGFYVGGKFGPSWVLASFKDNNKKYGGDLFASKELKPWLDLRVELGLGHSGGRQKYADLTSKTNFVNLAASCEFYLITIFTGLSQNTYGLNKPRLFDPYIGAGFGGYAFDAKQTWDLNPDTTSWRNSAEQGITLYVYGLVGVRVKLTDHWCITLEGQGNVPFSHRFDAHDGYGLTDDPREVCEANGNWVKMKGYDCFGTIMVGATYMFASSRWQNNKYNRAVYAKNRQTYVKNSQRARRR